MINVVCVWAGTAYTADYVQRLSSEVHSKTTEPVRFVCFTDAHREPISGVEFRQMPAMVFHGNKLWWYKIYLFSEESGLTGDCLYFDLDVMLLKPIDPLLTHAGDFVILQDFNRAFISNYKVSNSSVIKWKHERCRYIWDMFKSQIHEWTTKFRGDQDYITKVVAGNKLWWPADYACSFKWEWLEKPQYQDPIVLVFHGEPKPESYNFDIEKIRNDKLNRLSKNKVQR